LLATARYNKSIHSVINKKPAEVMRADPDDPQSDVHKKVKSPKFDKKTRKRFSAEQSVPGR